MAPADATLPRGRRQVHTEQGLPTRETDAHLEAALLNAVTSEGPITRGARLSAAGPLRPPSTRRRALQATGAARFAGGSRGSQRLGRGARERGRP